ncbi:ABC transporter substrate-binding protein [Paenibacillus cremeus]|uniref:ABC transporter substrate-binding protein n=1 Tax=Paenibacillus cremeus TaxID=2163881 RepID=A0A559KEE8_9BACL|nr:ABC transporter substrate-binding protein [Paenibacillus cremeus]TVY10483.1 ABC transporter substrate-binding protein [Paenibacillus cremeus]
MKHMFKKSLLGALVLSLGLTGCGTSTKSGTSGKDSQTKAAIVTADDVKTETTLTFWHALTGPHQDQLNKMVSGFNDKWKGKFKVEASNQGTYTDLSTKLATALTAKQLPTMTLGYEDWMYSHHEKDAVVALDDYITNAKVGMKDYEDIFQAFRDTTKLDGKTYAVPFNKSTEVLYVNDDLLAKAGVTAPKTDDELISASKAIKEKTGKPGYGADSLANYFITKTYQQNAPYHTGDKVNLTNDVSKKIAQTYQDGVKGGYFRIAGEDKFLSGPFNSGAVAMYQGSSAGAAFIKPNGFKFSVYPVPGGAGIQQGTNLSVFKTATPEQIAGAWEFIKYMTSVDPQVDFAMVTGYLPIRQSAAKSAKYVEFAKKNTVAQLFVDGKLKFFSDPVYKASTIGRSEIEAMMQKINSDTSASVDEALKKAQSAIEFAQKR